MVWLAWIFDAINNFGAVRQHLAELHGRKILDLERAVHLAPELDLNTWLAGHRAFNELVVGWYENAHGAVTFGLIAWLWWRRADLLPPLRAALIGVNLAALGVFWTWPVAPPRMLTDPRFLDLVALTRGESPHWTAGAISLDANQLAAFPSLHVAWAIWSAVALWRLSDRRWVRALALAHPIATTAVVTATANHYLADALGGAVLAALAIWLTDRLWSSWSSRAAPERPPRAAGAPHAR